MKARLTVVFSFIFSVALSQETLRVELIMNCYKVFDLSDLPDKSTSVTLTSMADGRKFVATTFGNGEYIAQGLAEGDYQLVAGYKAPFNSDTIIHIGKNPSLLKFCHDSRYRPLSKEETQEYEQQAMTDVSNHRLTLYRLTTDYPLSSKERKSLVRDMKSKFGVDYIFEGDANLYSREGFVAFNRYQAYNSVIKRHLDERFGTGWRTLLKTTDITFPLK